MTGISESQKIYKYINIIIYKYIIYINIYNINI